MRSRIWIGDVVRALAVARDEREQAKVLHLLGYEGSVAPPSDTPRTAGASMSPSGAHSKAPHAQAAPRHAAEPPPPAPDADPPKPHADEAHRPEPNAAVDGLPLLQPIRTEPADAPAQPGEPLAGPAPGRVSLPHLTLLEPRWTASILRAALSRQVDEGPVDIPALIDTLAHGRPVTRLPRRPVPTLRFGVQVLVDRSIGMQPFRRDQDDLVARIRAVVGAGLVDVGYFSGVPQRGTGPGARWTRTPYEPPARDTRVLLLSDLGLGGPAHDRTGGTRRDWEEFVTCVTRAGCPVVALSPYPPERRPTWMSRLLPVVTWDRVTTAGRTGVTVRRRTP